MLNDITVTKAVRTAAEDARARLIAERARIEARLRKLANTPQPDLTGLQQKSADMREKAENLQSEVNALTQTPKKAQAIGGIAVDSEYVIFIIDTSGSMSDIKDRVVCVLKGVLGAHPQVKKFHVMNSSGIYLPRSGYETQWMDYTKESTRKSAWRAVARWPGRWASASSPENGLKKALDKHGDMDNLAIYVFGDDHDGGTYAGVVDEITKKNRDPKTGKPRVRINGIGFLADSNAQSRGVNDPDSFASLMNELARRNRGAFVGMRADSAKRPGSRLGKSECPSG
ncbi:MAG: hypothetical protein OD918_01270 [Gammaproteobacteria bacterium]